MTKELAIQIVNETIIQNWYFYLVVLFISIVGSYFGALLKGLGKEKGKYQAIESSLQTIEKQVKITTKASQAIKSKIEHETWRKQELEVLKREKLEEYFLCLSSLNNALNSEMLEKLFGEKFNYDPMCFDKASMIQALYLPELLPEHHEVAKVVHEFTVWISDGMFLLAEQSSRGVVNPRPTREFMDKQPLLLKALVKPISDAMQKTRQVAHSINIEQTH